MTTPYPDPEQFPAEFTPGERATLTALKAWQEEAREVSDAKHAENRAQMLAFDQELKAVAAAVHAAFPDGDADGHRRYHEALIRKAEARARLYERLLSALIEKGMWALLVLLLTGLGLAIKEKFLK